MRSLGGSVARISRGSSPGTAVRGRTVSDAAITPPWYARGRFRLACGLRAGGSVLGEVGLETSQDGLGFVDGAADDFRGGKDLVDQAAVLAGQDRRLVEPPGPARLAPGFTDGVALGLGHRGDLGLAAEPLLDG